MASFLSDRRVASVISTLVGAFAMGCTPGSVEGDLGEGQFRYVCLDSADATCETAGPATGSFPSRIAVGSELGLSFFRNERSLPTGVVFPASPARMAITQRGFRALEPGAVAMLVRTSDGIGVLDFTHLALVRPASLRVIAPAEAKDGATLQLGFGAERTIVLVPVDVDGATLAGSLVYAWTSDAPNVVELEDLTTSRRARIAARQAGTAHLQISAVGVSEKLSLTVVVGGGGLAGAGGGTNVGGASGAGASGIAGTAGAGGTGASGAAATAGAGGAAGEGGTGASGAGGTGASGAAATAGAGGAAGEGGTGASGAAATAGAGGAAGEGGTGASGAAATAGAGGASEAGGAGGASGQGGQGG